MVHGASAFDAREERDTTIQGEAPAGWLREVQTQVDIHLQRFFDARRTDTARLIGGAPSLPREPLVDSMLVEALADLTMRGGKRLRPAVLVAALSAVRPTKTVRDVLPACAALELLQTYLLIHDDWMDGDLCRRGGASVHAMLRERVRDPQLGDALAILAGDLGSAYAWELMLEAAWSTPRGRDVTETFSRIHQEVVLGQELDLSGSKDVARMQRLKTGSYTVKGPLRIGALLGEASDVQLRALERYGAPLGEAFQIRDDLLGTFGDPRELGKSVGSDLRTGKRTALIHELEASVSSADRAPVAAVLGRAADEHELDVARAFLTSSGVRARVEAKLEGLVDDACSALDGGDLAEPGTSMLAELAGALTFRRK
jgi:geranylgeranyl diphosphate synthase type I